MERVLGVVGCVVRFCFRGRHGVKKLFLDLEHCLNVGSVATVVKVFSKLGTETGVLFHKVKFWQCPKVAHYKSKNGSVNE